MNSKTIYVSLACLIMGLLVGCVAGPVPIVGYPTGQTPKEKRLLASRTLQDGTVQNIFQQEIEHDYRLMMSPDGGRDSSPVKSGYRYFIQTGNNPETELKFLRSDPSTTVNDAAHVQSLVALPNGQWMGFGSESPSTMKFVTLITNPDSPSLGEYHYFVVAFTAERELSRLEIVEKADEANAVFDDNTGVMTLRFSTARERSFRLHGTRMEEITPAPDDRE